MKKLRCESCGGELKVEENGEYANCNYCRTRYKLNEDKTITIKIDKDLKDIYRDNYNDMKKFRLPFMLIPFIAFIIISISMFVLTEKHSTDIDQYNYNSGIELYSGTESSFFVGELLDKVVSLNIKNTRQITVVYNNISTSDRDELVNLKHSLSAEEYEVKLEYDDKGYVSKVIIEDIN